MNLSNSLSDSRRGGTRLSSFYFALLFLALQLPAQDWTRFRGPNGTGHSKGMTIPGQFEDKNIHWKTPLPGKGHSSPVVWSDRIFLTGMDETAGLFFVVQIDAKSGQVRWQREFPFKLFRKHPLNSYASATPATDAQAVYVSWATPERYALMALNHTGKTVWERDLGPYVSQHGCGPSPILFEGRVVLPNEQDGESFLIAVDQATGTNVWQTPRRTAVAAYSTPCLYTSENGRTQLIFNSQSHGIGAVDPNNGKVVWEYAKAFDKRSVSSPFIAAGLVFGSCGSGAGGHYVVAVKPPNGADRKQPELAFEIRQAAPYVPTGIAVGNMVFFYNDGGIVTCVDPSTGEVKWRERVSGQFFGSPIAINGKLVCVSAEGDLTVIAASDSFKPLGRFSLNETCHSTPAVAGGKLYVRTESHLYCLGER